eukprot:scaffold3273_cov148-Cylindrotheca_fusiformis.AAC.5
MILTSGFLITFCHPNLCAWQKARGLDNDDGNSNPISAHYISYSYSVTVSQSILVLLSIGCGDNLRTSHQEALQNELYFVLSLDSSQVETDCGAAKGENDLLNIQGDNAKSQQKGWQRMTKHILSDAGSFGGDGFDVSVGPVALTALEVSHRH